jgi:hypothetical protein
VQLRLTPLLAIAVAAVALLHAVAQAYLQLAQA